MEKLINREQLAGMNIHYLFYSLEYFLDAQKEAGFKTIELWPGTPHFFLSYIEYSDCKHVRKLLDERDLTVKVITPENCTYQYQFAAQEKEQFEKSMAYFKKALDAGEELGVETMAINSGWGYWNEDREEAWKRSRGNAVCSGRICQNKKYPTGNGISSSAGIQPCYYGI